MTHTQRSLLVIVTGTITLILLSVLVVQAQKPSILVINSYHADYAWVEAHNAALRDNLQDRAALDFLYLDSKRETDEVIARNVTDAMQIVHDTQPNVVILTDDFALKSLANPIMRLGIPVVYLGINANPRTYLGDMTLVTGVLERPLLKRSIVYLKEILGNELNKCLVLFDNGVTAHATATSLFANKNRMTFAQTVTDIRLNATYDQWKTNVLDAQRNGYDVIILGLYHTIRDAEGRHVPSEEIATWTSKNTPVPVFGFWDFAIGPDKAIGGLVLAGRPQGEQAAAIVNKLLDGRRIQTIQPTTAEHGRFLFSRSGLKKWHIILPDYFNQPKEPIFFMD